MYKIITEVEKTVTELVETEATLEQYVGHILKTAREEKKLSLNEVAEQLNRQISHTHLKNIEKGLLTLRLKDMILLSGFYQLHISELFPSVAVSAEE